MAVTTTSSLPAPIQQSFNLKLLAVPTPYLIHKLFAQKDRMPRNGGTVMRYRRYNKLGTATVPLGNSGATPPNKNLTAIDIDARIDWYGDWVEINEQVVLANQESVLNETALLLGIGLRETEDQLTSQMLASTASQVNSVNGTNGDVPTNLTQADVNVVTQALLSADARMFLSGIAGEDRFGTAPIRNAYVALCHTDLTSDLNGVNDFISVAQYPDQARVMDGEWGAVDNMRFFVSSFGSVSPNASANGNDVYNIFCLGKESYACVEQDGASARFIYRPAVYSGPLAQNVTLGYKFAEVPRILNDSWISNLRATLS